MSPSSAARRSKMCSGKKRNNGVKARGKRGVQLAILFHSQTAHCCAVLAPVRSVSLASSWPLGPDTRSEAPRGSAVTFISSRPGMVPSSDAVLAWVCEVALPNW
eukprot:10193862-Alexandrium_andersonii.AAC.1